MPKARVRFWSAASLLAPLIGCTPSGDETPAKNSPGIDVAVSVDVVYGHKMGMALTFDVYQPQGSNGAAVLFINSGGYVSPAYSVQNEAVESSGHRFISKEEIPIEWHQQFSFEDLLAEGFTVFDIRHGSSPKFTLPEIVDDVRSAVRFVRAHAGKFQLDADRIGVWGPSAGGYLALMLGSSGDEGDATSPDPVARASSRVKAVAAYYPADVDFAALARLNPALSERLLQTLPALQIEPEVLETFVLRHHVSDDDAPVLIIYPEGDPLTADCEGMYAAFQSHGVESSVIAISGTGHVFMLDGVYHPHHAERAMAEMVAWFQRHLLGL